jgi:hypothetical protein
MVNVPFERPLLVSQYSISSAREDSDLTQKGLHDPKYSVVGAESKSSCCFQNRWVSESASKKNNLVIRATSSKFAYEHGHLLGRSRSNGNTEGMFRHKQAGPLFVLGERWLHPATSVRNEFPLG